MDWSVDNNSPKLRSKEKKMKKRKKKPKTKSQT
jgi:hypothetical protein